MNIILRIPHKLAKRVYELAKKHERTFNEEVLAVLEAHCTKSEQEADTTSQQAKE